jgi:hypothetical protein
MKLRGFYAQHNEPYIGGKMQVDNEPSGAVFTEDRLHRLYLWRRWNKEGPWVMFIGLNPSTADERLNPGFHRSKKIKYRNTGGHGSRLNNESNKRAL